MCDSVRHLKPESHVHVDSAFWPPRRCLCSQPPSPIHHFQNVAIWCFQAPSSFLPAARPRARSATDSIDWSSERKDKIETLKQLTHMILPQSEWHWNMWTILNACCLRSKEAYWKRSKIALYLKCFLDVCWWYYSDRGPKKPQCIIYYLLGH